jgi:hypothetical protein
MSQSYNLVDNILNDKEFMQFANLFAENMNEELDLLQREEEILNYLKSGLLHEGNNTSASVSNNNTNVNAACIVTTGASLAEPPHNITKLNIPHHEEEGVITTKRVSKRTTMDPRTKSYIQIESGGGGKSSLNGNGIKTDIKALTKTKTQIKKITPFNPNSPFATKK